MKGLRSSLVFGLEWVVAAATLQAGGSGLNVAVVVNQNSTNSVQLGNYYCEQRQVPPQNLLRLTNWTGGNVAWSKADFESHLFNPLKAMLASRGLSNQVEYVLLSMDIPYRVTNGGLPSVSGLNATTTALFYGFKPDFDTPYYNPPSCNQPEGTSNSYAGSELPFRSVTNGSAWLAFMLTASNLAQARAIVDRGVAADGAFPTQTVRLAKSTDVSRNIRYVLFDDALFNARLLGRPAMIRTNSGSLYGLSNLLGYQNGVGYFSVPAGTFVPGAQADDLTSWGGALFLPNDQTTLLAFLAGGATASYGTVIEPCNYLTKFPSPQNYFLQGRGFSVAECYYQSVTNPYQGLLVGEPLAAPFAVRPGIAWSNLPPGAALSGTTNLALLCTAAEATRPVQQVDLFLDGRLLQTLTNIAPRQNNVLTVTLNGHAVSYTVPPSATLKSVAAGLAAELNKSATTNITKVRARAQGDRVELQSFLPGRPGDQISLAVSNAQGSAPVLTTWLWAARTNFLDTAAHGWRSFSVTNAVEADNYLQLQVVKTNGQTVTLAVTNPPANTNTSVLVQALTEAINTHADLLLPDGLVAEDFVAYDVYANQPGAEFNLRARSPGWAEAQIAVTLTGSANLAITPTGTQRLDEKVADLMPRNHLYVTAGLTNLLLQFAFNTATQADGLHELTAVAYEGSHVRTQQRATQSVRITNTPLAATLTTLVGGSNTLVTTSLRLAVAANTNAVSRIELFSTGGLLASATNQPSATFTVAGPYLQVGLHPFYALVTRTDGKQYRTETKWIRLVGADFAEPPFRVDLAAPPPALSWPVTVGRRYEVWSATNPAHPFQWRAGLTPSNSPAAWTEPLPGAPQQFYRVRAVP